MIVVRVLIVRRVFANHKEEIFNREEILKRPGPKTPGILFLFRISDFGLKSSRGVIFGVRKLSKLHCLTMKTELTNHPLH
jgi:hypothetical protein